MQRFQIATDTAVFSSSITAYVLTYTDDDVCIDLDTLCNICLYIAL